MAKQQQYETVDLTLEDLKKGLTPEQIARERRDIGEEKIRAFYKAFVRGYVEKCEREAVQAQEVQRG